MSTYILPDKLVHYRHDNPTIPFELLINNIAEVIKAVQEFKVELGLIESGFYESELIAISWKKISLLCLC